mgnify:CR=1 FL=1
MRRVGGTRLSISISVSITLAALISTFGATANATLTPSELITIKDLTASAQVLNAQKVRALVARPDLTAEESETALTAAIEPLAFNDARMVFVRELLFGGASAASRNVLVQAAVKSLIARADKVIDKYPSDLDKQPAALVELTKIYGFLGEEIANARAPGSPPRSQGHDPQVNVSNATYDACAQALGSHATRHPSLLKVDVTLPKETSRVRAQLELATVDMVSDSATRKIDAADRVGLTGSRRAFLTELGVLLLDSGAGSDARIDRVRAALLRLPGARADVSAIAFGDEHPALKARGVIVGTKTDLSTTTATADWFTDEVRPSPLDAPVAELARELARIAVKRALDSRPELRLAAERDVRSIGTDANKTIGKPSDLTPESVLSAAVSALVIDAPSTVQLAMARFYANKPESAAILSDALGVLATFGSTGEGLSFGLGQTRADGSTETLQTTNVRLNADGTVGAFSMDGARWEITRGDVGTIAACKRDNQPVTLAMLPRARVPVTAGVSWSGSGLVLARLVGAPNAGIGGASRLRVSATTDLDATALPSPGDDLVLEATASVTGSAFVLVRATSGKPGVRGVGFEIDSRGVGLRVIDDTSSIDLAPPVPLPVDGSIKLKLALKGNRFEATVGTVTSRGVLPPSTAHGDVVFAVRKDGSVDVSGLSVRKN